MDLVFKTPVTCCHRQTPRSRQKSHLQHVGLDASEFGLEVSKVSISTTFHHPEGSCCYCIRESVLSGGRKQELPTSLLQFWQTPSRRASEIFSYQGSAKTCHQHLLHIWVWCRPMLSSLAWVECVLMIGCSRLMGCNSFWMFGNIFVHFVPRLVEHVRAGECIPLKVLQSLTFSRGCFSTRTAVN